MALSALLLDLDGMLVDANAAHAEAMRRAAAEFGIALNRDVFDAGIGKGADLLAADLFGDAFEAAHGDAWRDAAGRHFKEIIERKPLRLFDGALALVDAARERGLRLALASSSSEDDLDATFASVGTDLRERVDVATTSSDADASKPHPDILRVAADTLGVPPAACALVGDTRFDGEAARRAGVAFVGVATWRDSQADLRGASARAAFASTADLVKHLDAALGAAAPGAHALSSESAAGGVVVGEHVERAADGLEGHGRAGGSPQGARAAAGACRGSCETPQGQGGWGMGDRLRQSGRAGGRPGRSEPPVRAAPRVVRCGRHGPLRSVPPAPRGRSPSFELTRVSICETAPFSAPHSLRRSHERGNPE